jgi:hypothetical protein
VETATHLIWPLLLAGQRKRHTKYLISEGIIASIMVSKNNYDRLMVLLFPWALLSTAAATTTE